MNNMSMLEWALHYAANGWHVFPLHGINNEGGCNCGNPNCPDKGKHPFTRRGSKEATTDEKTIRQWFGIAGVSLNIGIATGEISDITVIDIDIGEGKEGAQNWHSLIEDNGEPITKIARTGSGGLHLFFKYNSALKTAGDVFGKGIDVRNDGGYIVACPSKHRSGGIYDWIDYDIDLAPLPSWLSRPKKRKKKNGSSFLAKKYSIEEVKMMLKYVDFNDRDIWRYVGIILGRYFKRSEEAWDAYVEWSEQYQGKKGRNHDYIMNEAFNTLSQEDNGGDELTINTIVKLAIEGGWTPKKGEVPIENFVYSAPDNGFIYRPTNTIWTATAVNFASSPINVNGDLIEPAVWLKENRLATSITCSPSLEEFYIKGIDCQEGELIRVEGAAVYNSYRKPTIQLGDAKLARPFIEHVHKVFNQEGDAEQFLNYMAHRVQKPWEKPRFCLLIGGGQGVGKDTAVEFCCPAIGPWNVSNIEPSILESNFNEYCASVLVRINESSNTMEMNKWAFNERTKVLIAGLPDVCTINPKYGKKYSVKMYCGVIITTNHLNGGIYIPMDDRRYDVIQAATKEEMGLANEKDRNEYFSGLWDWFYEGGINHIAAYLEEKDISGFDPDLGQRKTNAWRQIVMSGLTSDEWLDDILESEGRPEFIRADRIISIAAGNGEKESDVKRKLSNAMGRLGYSVRRCSTTKDGRWKKFGKKITVYAREDAPANIDWDSLNGEAF